jgi:putative flippase GtrA/GT2 family glycosyltransferase
MHVRCTGGDEVVAERVASVAPVDVQGANSAQQEVPELGSAEDAEASPAGHKPAVPGQRASRAAASRGKHAAPPTPTEGHGKRFTIFSAIGGGIFVLGLAMQAVLTGRLHMPAFASYLLQAVVSVELSFVLNRWLTWRDRDTALWTAFGRFNAQKTITIALNAGLYAGLLHIGMNYLIANIVLTIVFTVVNYAAGDKLVFSPRKARSAEVAVAEPRTIPLPAVQLAGPPVSVVIPCRNNEQTIGAAVQSLLEQDYPSLAEIILIGSPDDTTWDGLAGIDDPRLTLIERAAPPGVRDANFKRDVGIKMTKCALVALVDSDIVLPPEWMSSAVSAMQMSGVSCVAGGMKSIHDSFWGRYTDNTVIGAKTPRIAANYVVTSENFGSGGRKPPVTANTLFTRTLYDSCGIDPTWSHGSYEDYEWFWRVVRAGHSVLVCRDLFGWHHHRRGIGALMKEYRRSARGCAYFIRAHLDCPFAKRRLLQAALIPLAALVGAAGLALVAVRGDSPSVAALLLGCVGLLAAQQILRLRRLEAVAYPVVGLTLGLVYTTGLVGHLARAPRALVAAARTQAQPAVSIAGSPGAARPAVGRPAFVDAPRPSRRAPRNLAPLALFAICVVQAALSASLIWSNTAFTDEGDYIWTGRLVLAHWLHGAPLPNLSALSGSPLIYPPLAALTDAAGGLAAVRILSLAFMIAATVLLYLTATRLIGRTGATFAAALWAFTEPVVRLAFATYDPLSVLLTALSAWLIVQAGVRRHRGELVAAAAAIAALADVTAFSGMVIDPALILFAYLVWRPRMGKGAAASAAGWLAGGLVVFLCAALTVTHSWAGTIYTVLIRTVPDHQPTELVVTDIWSYAGLVIVVAMVGVILAIATGQPGTKALLALVGLAVFLVPAAQLVEQTSWSLDKHLAYGIWFAAIAGGYAADTLIRWLPGAARWAAAACCGVALVYPVVTCWQSAYGVYHGWPNATSWVAALRPAVRDSTGLIETSGQQHVAEYYLSGGSDWQRWVNATLPLDPVQLPASTWPSYYAGQLAGGQYGTIALFYSAGSDQAEQVAERDLKAGRVGLSYAQLAQLPNLIGTAPGTAALTSDLRDDPAYRLVAIGPYDTTTLGGGHIYGVYAIWVKAAR